MIVVKIASFILCVEIILLILYLIKYETDEISKSKRGYILVTLNIIALILMLILISTIFK